MKDHNATANPRFGRWHPRPIRTFRGTATLDQDKRSQTLQCLYASHDINRHRHVHQHQVCDRAACKHPRDIHRRLQTSDLMSEKLRYRANHPWPMMPNARRAFGKGSFVQLLAHQAKRARQGSGDTRGPRKCVPPTTPRVHTAESVLARGSGGRRPSRSASGIMQPRVRRAQTHTIHHQSK
jgi:hypothetical protein